MSDPPKPPVATKRRSLRATLAYDGSNYAGWQVQLRARTLQGVFEQALHKITKEEVRATASGRTDAGVHALGQVVGFQAKWRPEASVMAAALNASLPADMHVWGVEEAPLGFHAIRDARSKRYRYVIRDSAQPDIFSRLYAWQTRHRLDENAMRQAAARLLGEHDFASFETAGSQRATTVRTITDLQVEREGERIVIEVAANGFLYNMVRNIVGALYEVGRGAQAAAWLDDVLAARSRRSAGVTAPPQGLFLAHVDYDQ